jgi:hypothetical protein
MENLNFKENILQNWINSDKNLSDVLVEIQELSRYAKSPDQDCKELL